LREQRGMTQEEAAPVSGFDYKYFQRIEYGQRNLSLTSLAKLAKAFKVTIVEIVSIES
jgi:transcriptional regulator with XRE-family HTH domain